MRFVLLFSILLTFIENQIEKEKLQQLKKLFLNNTEYPEGFETQIKKLNVESQILVQLITINSTPLALTQLGIEEDVAKDILEEAAMMDKTENNFKDLTESKTGPYYVNYHGYSVKTVKIDQQSQYLAAASFESKPEFIPQYTKITKCRKILGLKMCKDVQVQKPFVLTEELKELVINSVHAQLNKAIIQKIDELIKH